MAFECEVGDFNTSDAGGTGEYDVSLADSGLTPKAVRLRCTGSTSDGAYQDDFILAEGFAVDGTEYSICETSQDNQGTSVVSTRQAGKVLVVSDPSDGSILLEIAMGATPFSAGKFTVDIQTYTAGITVEWQVLGGADSDWEIVDFSISASGNKTVSTTNVPVCCHFLSNNNEELSENGSGAHFNDRSAAFCKGYMDDTDQAEMCVNVEDNVGTTNGQVIIGTTKAFVSYSTKSGGWLRGGEFGFVSFNSGPNGFTINVTDAPASPIYIRALVGSGSNWDAQSKTAPTSPGQLTATNTDGFTPSGLEIWGKGGVVSAMSVNLGWAANVDGTKANTQQNSALASDHDNIGTSDSKRQTNLDYLIIQDDAGSTSLDNTAVVQSWNADGVTFDFDAAASADTLIVIQFGSGTETPAVSGQRVFNTAA